MIIVYLEFYFVSHLVQRERYIKYSNKIKTGIDKQD